MTVPDLWVERVHLGEATEDERARVMGDDDARARLEALASADTAFLEAHPADVVVPEIERRLHVARTRDAVDAPNQPWGWVALLLVPTLAAGLALMSLQPTATATDRVVDPVDGVVTAKGLKPRIHVSRLVQGGPVSINSGIVLRKGDRIQVGYTSGDATHGVLFSIDGRDTVTVHLPADGSDTHLQPGRNAAPTAYELDDAPKFERFFLVAAGHPLDLDGVLEQANALVESGNAYKGDLQVADDVAVKSLLIRKEEQ